MMNSNKPIAIKELSFKPDASPNWLAITLAMVFPVSPSERGIWIVFPISMVTAIVSPKARPKAST